MLWMVKRVFYGPEGKVVSQQRGQHWDVNRREMVVLFPFVLLVFWMGLFPNHFLRYSEASLKHWVDNRHDYGLDILYSESGKQRGIEVIESFEVMDLEGEDIDAN